jgi:hypothetical protein
MTIERRTSLGLDDIKAVTFECGQCKARTTTPVTSLKLPPQTCASCNSVWWSGRDVATNTSTSAPAPVGFIQALIVLRALIRDNKDDFRILLEFDDSENPASAVD